MKESPNDLRRPGTVAVPRLSVVIPVFNECESIEPLVRETSAALAATDHEILVVDDGSRDGTRATLQRMLNSGFPRLRVVFHERNYGQSAAIDTGMRSAAADWVATLDGDGQNDPADIPALVATRDRGGEVRLVCGLRRQRRDTFIRRLSSRLANAVRSAILGDATPDTGCGLKLIHRETYLRLPAFNHMHRFLPALFLRAGAVVISSEVGHRPRRAGISKYGVRNRLWVGLVDLAGVAWLQRRPLEVKFQEVEGNDI